MWCVVIMFLRKYCFGTLMYFVAFDVLCLVFFISFIKCILEPLLLLLLAFLIIGFCSHAFVGLCFYCKQNLVCESLKLNYLKLYCFITWFSFIEFVFNFFTNLFESTLLGTNCLLLDLSSLFYLFWVINCRFQSDYCLCCFFVCDCFMFELTCIKTSSKES